MNLYVQHQTIFLHKYKIYYNNSRMTSSQTLKSLRSQALLPNKLEPTFISTSQFLYPSSKSQQKYFLSTCNQQYYYGTLNEKGQPESNSGICIFKDGSYYVGQLKEGNIEGKGKFTDLEQSFMYEGDWKKGKPNGRGIEMIQNNKYEGSFCDGKKHGFGELFYADGGKYEGHFNMGIIEGKGKYYTKTMLWSGQWEKGYLEGEGTQTIAKEDINDLGGASEYKGNFVKGEKSGEGKFNWKGEYEYEGPFKNGQVNGDGVCTIKDKTYNGKWEEGTEIRLSQVKK